MQTVEQALEPAYTADSTSARPVTAWIESHDGAIARGQVELLSEEEALIEVADAGGLDPGDEVAVRLSYDAASPTLGLLARIVWIIERGEAWECEVQWMPCAARECLAPAIAALS